jgi:hypothetical protein
MSDADQSLSTEFPIADTAESKKCCGWATWALAAMAITTLISLSTAAYFAGRAAQATSLRTSAIDGLFPNIDAAAAVTSEKFSIATGPVSEEAEGLFMLDHNSGLLQCAVIYPRVGRFMANFAINVSEALPSGGKGGQYMIATGLANFQSSSSRPAGSSVVYVLEVTSGNYACYGIPFSNAMMNSKQPQQSPLVLISTGTANPLIDRDSLR